MLRAHDEIGQIYEHIYKSGNETSNKLPILASRRNCYLFPFEVLSNKMPIEAIRIVGLRRVQNKPLGFTVEINSQNTLSVARILSGGIIDKQCLLNTGDVILEVNGIPISTPEALQSEVSRSKGDLTLKIAPRVFDEVAEKRVVNCHSIDNPGKKLTVSNI